LEHSCPHEHRFDDVGLARSQIDPSCECRADTHACPAIADISRVLARRGPTSSALLHLHHFDFIVNLGHVSRNNRHMLPRSIVRLDMQYCISHTPLTPANSAHAADKDLITGPGLPEAYRSHPARAVSVKMVNQIAKSTLSHHPESPKMHKRSIPRQMLDYFLSIAVITYLILRHRMSTCADISILH
jgi:hypothetical protein